MPAPMPQRTILIGLALLAASGRGAAPCEGLEGAEAQACLRQQANSAQWAQTPQLLAPPEAVQSTITSISRRQGGEMVFRLANGQVWMQQAVGHLLADPGERVIVAPARFGGHILTTERSASARVRRIEVENE